MTVALPEACALDRALQGGLRTVFQPIVDLATSSVVGYEALSRGPAASPLASPDALFDVARAAGRTVELDWACRCQAFRIAAAQLDPGLRLFVNAEPHAFARACPEHLLPDWLAGYRGVRVVVELTERYLLDDPAGLLRARTTLAELGWELALDDVGATDATVALLPLLQPDVVKLDRSLLLGGGRAGDQALAAVQSYAARTGAPVIAEGISSAAELARAGELGARWGQGFLLGRPAPLPPRVLPPAPRRPHPAAAGTGGRLPADPLGLLTGARGTTPYDADVMAGVAAVLDLAAQGGVGALLVVTAGTPAAMAALGPRLDRLCGPCALVVVLAGPDVVCRSLLPRVSDLPASDVVRDDVGAVLLAPDRALAYTARPVGAAGWTWARSDDPLEVAAAARTLLGRVTPVRSGP